MRVLRFTKLIVTAVIFISLFIALPDCIFPDENHNTIIQKTDIDEYPKVGVYLNFNEDSMLGYKELTEDNFTILENNIEIEDFSVGKVTSISEPIGVVLVIDTSGSMKGEPIEDARRAALLFMDEMESIDEFSVVGFDDEVTVYSAFTSDRQQLKDSIIRMEAEGETSLFDGIVMGLDQFRDQEKIEHKYLIVLSDGMDTVSKLTSQDAVIKAREDEVIIYSIALMSYDFNPTDIREISDESGGELLIAASSGELKDLYSSISRKIRNQYRVLYTSSWPNTETIDITIDIENSGLESSVNTSYKNPFYAPYPEKTMISSRQPYLEIFDIWWVQLIIYAVIFIGIVMLLYIFILLIIPPRRALKKKMEFYEYKDIGKKFEDKTSKEKRSKLVGGIVNLVSKAASKRGFKELFDLRLDRAGMNIRSAEFITLHIIIVVILSLLSYFFINNILITGLVLLIAILFPFAILNFRTEKRLQRFQEQLPDILQLVSGSLKAGYSFNQALSMIVDESKPPISDEFKRVLSEIRMGLPEKEALENMTTRINSEYLNWTVISINIQREVGGNLAEVLESMADTIRERDKVMRQIKTLTAEGRISAYILIALPFLLAGLMFFLNRDYIGLLLTTSTGLIMLSISAVLMLIGIFWIIKIIQIKY